MNPHDGRPSMEDFIDAIETMIKSRCGVAACSIQIAELDGTANAMFCILDELEPTRNYIIDKMKEALDRAKRFDNTSPSDQTQETDEPPAQKLN